MALEPGQIIDSKYRVIRRIGEGGMGTVYEGLNSRIGKRVAIKVLHAQVAAMPDFVERFEREARAAARIGSSHVCDVLDLGDLPNGDRFIVMEYLDGVSFEDRLIERGKLTPEQLAPIAFELLEGLGTMHNARVVHRDLKPANVFLARTSGGRGEVVKILDFGVAKLLPFGGEVGTMTQTGTMMGTPLYMSPEQARGARDVDGRTDIYAASVMFYRALAGVLPYNADTLNELLFKIVLEDPKPLREVAPEIDEAFAAIIHKGLARDLAQRYTSAREYQAEIAAWGKAQGRSSLSFAVTHRSDHPPATPITLPDPAAAKGAGAGSADAQSSSAPGTPIAWSENAPGQGSAPKLVAATVLTPISSTPQTGPAGAGAAPGSGPTLASSSSQALATSAASKDENLVIANARTAPAAPLPDVAGRPSTGATTSSSSARKSQTRMIAGIVGAGAVAVVAIFAFGRAGSEKPTPTGMTPVTSSTPSSSPAAQLVASGATAELPSTPPSAQSSASADAGSASASATAAPLPAETSVAARNAGTPRKPDPKATPAGGAPTTTTAPGSTASAPSATAAATTAAPSSSAKPAGSARKFRTNID